MDEIIQIIYKSCDSSNTNSVQIDRLIEYVSPFMADNRSELDALQAALDPKNNNPSISYKTFSTVMGDWIAKIEAKNLESGRFGENNSVSTFLNSFNQSNASSPSNNSNNNNNNSNVQKQINPIDKNVNFTVTQSIIGEENRKLRYELTKVTTELKLVTQQLLEAEEIIKKIDSNSTKICSQVKKASEKSNENQLEFDELLEEIDKMKQKNCTLEKMLKSEQKQNELVSNQLTRLENENIKLESKIEKVTISNRQHLVLLNQLQDTIDEKETELSLFAEIIEDLKQQIDHKSELVSFYLNENNLNKEKIQYFEKLIKEIECGSVQASCGDFNQGLAYNYSPILLHQIANPVTPSMSTPMFKVKKGSTSSPIKRDTTTDSDSFPEALIFANPRPLPKNLKEELTNIFSEDSREEVRRLQCALYEDENLKKNLFQGIKRLSIDNDSLQDYKRKCEDLQKNISQHERIIEELREELNRIRTGNVPETADKCLEVNMIENELEYYKMEFNNEKRINIELNLEIDNLKNNISKLTNTVDNMELKLNEYTLMELKRAMKEYNIDRSCQTDFDNLPKLANSQKTNFAKQQIKLERLNERLSNVENKLLVERSINTNLEKKRNETLKQVGELIDEIESHKKKYIEQTELISSLLSEKMGLFEQIVAQEAQLKSVQNAKEALTEEIKQLLNEKDISNQNLHHALARSSTEALQTVHLQKQNKTLFSKIANLKQKINYDFIKQIRLRKHLIDLKAAYTRSLLEKSSEINNLKRKTEVDDIILFLSANNADLINGLLKVVRKFNFDREMREFLNDSFFGVEEVNIENEMRKLSSNVKWILLVFDVFGAKFFHLIEAERAQDGTFCVLEADNSINNSDNSLLSSSLDDSIAQNEMDVEAVISCTNDSFLDNLELNDSDLKHLSQKEIKEKFTALALHLTIDIPTSTSRFLNEKVHLERLLVKYFAYLKYNIDVLNSLNVSELRNAINCLQILKSLTEDVLTSAVSYGVLQYEKRTVNCWHLVINYVAALSKELEEVRRIEANKAVQAARKDIQLKRGRVSEFRSRCLEKVKFYVLLFLFVLIFFVVILFYYVDSMCPKDTYICPLETVLNYVIDQKNLQLF